VTPLLRAYAALSRGALPFVARTEGRKLAAAGLGARTGEKLGHATMPRPPGKLLWVHAASVGESLSALALVARFSARLEVLVTTGTATSATLMADRLPPRARHQFAPLDAPRPVTRFLDHWQPDAALFIESELWPNTISALGARGVPLALVNARLSPRSLKRWQKRPATAEALLGHFSLVMTQTRDLAQALKALGAADARQAQNLKSLADPLPTDPALMAQVPKKAWVAASTHPGEEDIVLNAHAILLEQHPSLTLLLAPRHPSRAEELAALIAKRGWPAPRRSSGAGPDGPVWLMDTLGELGSLYAAAPIVFLGGSLVRIGGHNPYEPAQHGAAIISGPYTGNFQPNFDAFHAKSAAQSVSNAQELANKVGNLLSHPPLLYVRRGASRAMAHDQAESLDEIERELSEKLGV